MTGVSAEVRARKPFLREWHNRLGKIKSPKTENNLVAPTCGTYQQLCARAANWLWPWSTKDYPGFRKGVIGVLGHRITTWGAVQHWVHDRRPFPVWAAEAFRDHIRRRCESGMQLAAELDDYIRVHESKLPHYNLPPTRGFYQAKATGARPPDE